ncbi:MAG: DUF2283 domain-containing protein [Chloroflexi bacterium]|nr:DUF2283 domain-containing protein [Chloroflexota bacterium]
MRISYDHKVDAVLIELSDDAPSCTEDLAKGITVDFTRDRRIVSIEILDASQVLEPAALTRVEVEGLPTVAVAPVSAQ